MEYLQTLWENMPRMEWRDILDILIVAFLIFKLMPIFRSTGTGRIALVVVAVVVFTWLTGVLRFHTLHFILNMMLEVGVIAVIILYQPELRRMLDHVTNIKLRSFLGLKKQSQDMEQEIRQVVRACEIMGNEKVGALLVFARDSRLDEYFKTGTIVDAQLSDQLLRNLFFPKAALHDGAVIVREGRVTAAGCVLPLSNSNRLSADLGTRHRAAVGISEVTDAVAVVVSEETGAISIAVGGVLKRRLAPKMLERMLRNELCPDEDAQEENIVVKLRQKLQKKDKGGNDQDGQEQHTQKTEETE